MKLTNEELQQIIQEELESVLEEIELEERCQKGYVTHKTRKTKKMFGRTYRNCVKPKKKKRRKVRRESMIGLPSAVEKQAMDDYDAGLKPQQPDNQEYMAAYEKYEEYMKDPSTDLEIDDSPVIDEKKRKKRKKAGTESSKESSLRDWFGRKGAKGKKKGWVDCNAPDGKGGYKSCGRSSGEKRKKYPACRPTPGACKERGKGKSWGKKAKKRGKRK